MLLELYVLVLVLHGCWCTDLVYTVEERRNPETLIGDISKDSLTVTSIPSEERSLVTFIQLKQDKQNGPQLFKIHKETGKLYTVEVLDAEIICKRNSECFRMLDVAIQKGTSTIKILEVKVIIQDVNDHQPTFPEKKIHIEFSEGDGIGIRKAISSARDDDIGTKNSNITYQLIKNRKEPFKLTELRNVAGKSYLSITLEKMLDREAKDSYLLQVTAKDGASPPKQGILDVYISVSDLNDNTPIFSKDTYKVTIKNEPSKHLPIATVSASDLDAGENGQVSYHFSSETPEKLKTYFELNEKTGKIFFVKKFSLEQEMTHSLFIEATDKGSPPLSSLAKFQVSVTGQENSAPTININFVSEKIGNTVKIPENLKVGGFIAYVKIFDHDNGENGEVSCSLDHDRFQLHNLSTKKYQVILTTKLDRETETDYDIEISCQDKGSPPLQSKSKFSIKVTDVNDVRPQFSMETFKFLIEENEKSRFSVGFINATDPDLGVGGKLTYSLLTNNKQFLPFKIKDDGMISAIMSLDHEFQNIYKFQVFVKDNGIPSLNNTVNVIVEVTDKNDNAPYFTFPSVNPYNMDVVYYRHHSKNITCVKAADGDSQENAFLKYEIIRGNDKQMFTINQYTGLLTFNRVLAQQDAGSYELVFVVKDSGSPVLSATTSMFFTVTVSNKTSEMLSAVHTITEDKVDLTSVIIITVVAVTVAVIITASISVCIIRCNDQRNVTYAHAMTPANAGVVGSSGRYMSDQRHLMCPSKQGISWPTAVNVNKNQSDKMRNAHINLTNTNAHPTEKLPSQQQRSASLSQTSTNVESQAYIEEAANLSNSQKTKSPLAASSEYLNHPSPKLPHIKRKNSRRGACSIRDVEIPEVYTSQYCNSPTKQRGQSSQETEMRPLGQTVNYPSDTTIVARGFYTPALSQHDDNKDSVAEDSNSSDTSLPSTGNIYRNPRPLPPVPK